MGLQWLLPPTGQVLAPCLAHQDPAPLASFLGMLHNTQLQRASWRCSAPSWARCLCPCCCFGLTLGQRTLSPRPPWTGVGYFLLSWGQREGPGLAPGAEQGTRWDWDSGCMDHSVGTQRRNGRWQGRCVGGSGERAGIATWMMQPCTNVDRLLSWALFSEVKSRK